MKWPADDQAKLIAFYGDPGTGEPGRQLVKVIPPFQMYYDGTPLSGLSFHKLAAPALTAVLNQIWEHYGRDQATIDRLGVSRTAGTYNPREVRGSATKWSNHAYGAAIDINAEENGFNVSGNIPIPVICAFKAQGFRWGGDYKGRTDPMHFEACASGEPQRSFEEWMTFYGAEARTATDTPLLRKGAHGEAVKRLQTLLNVHGAVLKVDGDFGPVTLVSVQAFQRVHDLDPDGIVGDRTWEKLK